MRRPLLLWKLYPSYLLIVLLMLAAVGGYATYAIRKFHIQRRTSDLEVRAYLLLRRLPFPFPQAPSDSLNSLVWQLGNESSTRVTIVSPSGRPLADSELRLGNENISHLPEIRAALQGGVGVARRYSSVAGSTLLYVAVPVHWEDDIKGAIRVAVSLASMRAELRELNLRLLASGLVAALFAALITYILARNLGRSAAEMKEGAERFAAGDFSARVPLPDTHELAGLAIALNHMAEQLDEKIRTVTLQRNELDAILASLREAVVAVDHHEHVLFVNRVAAELLDLDPERAVGRLMQEVVRISELQQFIHGMLSGRAASADTELHLEPQGRTLQVTGTELRDAAGRRIGLLIVLNDVTRLRRLELVRREFVANVSHELKTPVTAIKGLVETLGELGPGEEEATRSFLARINRNSDRLNAIIDDLLALSRIEQEQDRGMVSLVEGSLRAVAEAAVQSVSAKAAEHRVGIQMQGGEDFLARINPTLLEQAVVNLLDNAIKYSEPGRRVTVEVVRSGAGAVIRVRDQGWGIAAEHVPRIFERFYRVDKARSRKLGGTGLGLSIVKHVVQAHGGHVAVESTPGIGSTFSIYLPVVHTPV